MEMKMSGVSKERGQSKFSSSCIYVWCELGELGSRGNSRFPCVTSVVETFSSERVTFSIPPNINVGVPLRKEPTVLAHGLFYHKPPTEFQMCI